MKSAILKFLSAEANPFASQTAEGSLQFHTAQEVDRPEAGFTGTWFLGQVPRALKNGFKGPGTLIRGGDTRGRDRQNHNPVRYR